MRSLIGDFFLNSTIIVVVLSMSYSVEETSYFFHDMVAYLPAILACLFTVMKPLSALSFLLAVLMSIPSALTLIVPSYFNYENIHKWDFQGTSGLSAMSIFSFSAYVVLCTSGALVGSIINKVCQKSKSRANSNLIR